MQILVAEKTLLAGRIPHIDILRLDGLYSAARHPLNRLLLENDTRGGRQPVNVVHRDSTMTALFQTTLHPRGRRIRNIAEPSHSIRAEFYAAEAAKLGFLALDFNPADRSGGKIVNTVFGNILSLQNYSRYLSGGPNGRQGKIMSALLPVVNHLIRQNPEHQSSLVYSADRTLCINFSGLRIKARIGSSGLLEPTAEEADTEIIFRNGAVQRTLQGGRPGVGGTEIDSDLMPGMPLLPILGGLRYDAGDDLNRIFGETAAENISARAVAIGDTVKQIGKSIAEQIGEFVRKPESPVSDQATTAAWTEEVDKLRDDAARLDARLDRLERDIQT